jgi:hypothetical protein
MPAVRRTTSSRINQLHQGRSFASTVAVSQLVLKRQIHCDVPPGPGSAIEADRAAQGLDAVGQADHRYRGPAGERAQRRAKTTLGKDRRVEPARDLLQLGRRVGQSRRDPGQLSSS